MVPTSPLQIPGGLTPSSGSSRIIWTRPRRSNLTYSELTSDLMPGGLRAAFWPSFIFSWGRLLLIGRFPALHRPLLLASIRAHPFLGRRQKRLLRSRGASVPLPFRFTLLVLLLGELPAPQVSYSPLMWPSTWPRPGPSSASRVSPTVFEERPAQSGLLHKQWLDGQLGEGSSLHLKSCLLYTSPSPRD